MELNSWQNQFSGGPLFLLRMSNGYSAMGGQTLNPYGRKI